MDSYFLLIHGVSVVYKPKSSNKSIPHKAMLNLFQSVNNLRLTIKGNRASIFKNRKKKILVHFDLLLTALNRGDNPCLTLLPVCLRCSSKPNCHLIKGLGLKFCQPRLRLFLSIDNALFDCFPQDGYILQFFLQTKLTISAL